MSWDPHPDIRREEQLDAADMLDNTRGEDDKGDLDDANAHCGEQEQPFVCNTRSLQCLRVWYTAASTPVACCQKAQPTPAINSARCAPVAGKKTRRKPASSESGLVSRRSPRKVSMVASASSDV